MLYKSLKMKKGIFESMKKLFLKVKIQFLKEKRNIS